MECITIDQLMKHAVLQREVEKLVVPVVEIHNKIIKTFNQEKIGSPYPTQWSYLPEYNY